MTSAVDSPKPSNIKQFFHTLTPSNILVNFISSIMVWLIVVILITSYAALIFNGRLEAYYGAGIGIAMVANIVISFFTAIFGSDRATVGQVQSTSAVILGTMSVSLIALVPAMMPDDILFYTVVLTISLASILTGLFFLILGVLGAGNLIRYIPYPVIGGFLAGTGWLLVQGALNIMVDLRLNLDTVFILVEGDVLARWLPGVLVGGLLVWMTRRSSNVFILPVVIIAVLAIFYGGLLASEGTIDTSAQQSWFLASVGDATLWQFPDYSVILQLDGRLVLAQGASMAAVVIICTLHLLLNSSALELVIDRELDLNRELMITGVGNALAGVLGGGIIGFPSVTLTTFVHRLGGYGRFVGVMLSLLLTLTMVFGASVITVFPRIVLGGVIMYLGFNFLVEWLYDAWFKLPFKDYLLLFGIFLVISIIGFLEGVVVGVIATIILFVLEYSQISIVKQEFSGSVFRSNIDRSYDENVLLRDLGQYVWILRLQGFIFFGTSHQFYQSVKARVLDKDNEALLYVILDFRLVRGIDVSTVVDFTKLKQLSKMHGIHILFANVSPEIAEVLIDCGFGELDSGVSKQFDDLDHAMEWCENTLLSHSELPDSKSITVEEQFESRTMTRMLDVSTISKYLERVEIKAGKYIMRQGDDPDVLYFIESGRVDIQLELEDGKSVRLRSMRAGTIVGEVGFYLGRPRSASIVVSEKGIFQKLTRDAYYKMGEEQPEAASGFHVFIACVVSERLASTNHMVEVLMG